MFIIFLLSFNFSTFLFILFFDFFFISKFVEKFPYQDWHWNFLLNTFSTSNTLEELQFHCRKTHATYRCNAWIKIYYRLLQNLEELGFNLILRIEWLKNNFKRFDDDELNGGNHAFCFAFWLKRISPRLILVKSSRVESHHKYKLPNSFPEKNFHSPLYQSKLIGKQSKEIFHYLIILQAKIISRSKHSEA